MTDDLPEIADERVEAYLDRVLLAARGRPREIRRTLAEVESHLRDAVAAGLAEGLAEEAAVTRALARFGPPEAAMRGMPRRAAYRTLLAQLVEAVLLLAGSFGLAAGVAAVPVTVLGLSRGLGFVTGDVPAERLTTAAQLDHFEEVVRAHLMVGFVGVLVVVGWLVLHAHRKEWPAVLPAGFDLTLAAALLTAVGATVLVVALRDLAAGRLAGTGDLLSTGAAVAVAALLCWALFARGALRMAGRATGATGAAEGVAPRRAGSW